MSGKRTDNVVDLINCEITITILNEIFPFVAHDLHKQMMLLLWEVEKVHVDHRAREVFHHFFWSIDS